MARRRRKITGYTAATLVRRLEELSSETERMGSDGRLPIGKAVGARVAILQAIKALEGGS